MLWYTHDVNLMNCIHFFMWILFKVGFITNHIFKIKILLENYDTNQNQTDLQGDVPPSFEYNYAL